MKTNVKKKQNSSRGFSLCRLARAVMVLLAFAVFLAPDLDSDRSTPTFLVGAEEDVPGLADRDFVAALVLTVSRDVLEAPRSEVADLS
eukprot:CAMPEP_0113501220 /NCGR_PEP_ID=MMETSP0014_2-20120614/32827_1 /TAXON_ID=2857 /ORGANISM="Nitzschia sp." /LENGTH=87 /DNA_ID=CAMNT_0000395771 /DNA_START=534 /DNA_END=793 /DNA_ORIENTATION=+ /assembly_acc=CAM_ASM_000159